MNPLRLPPTTPLRPVWLLVGLVSTLSCGSAELLDGDLVASQSKVLAPLTAGAQTIRPQSTGNLCLQPQNNSTDNGTAVILATCSDGASQAWANTDGTLRVGNKCLDVTAGKKKNGTKLQLWDCGQNNDNQKLAFIGGSIKWGNNNKCLDITDGRISDGTAVQIWDCVDNNTNQQWSLQGATNSAGPQNQAAQGTSGYQRVSGTQIVDKNNQPIQWKGTNLGGWLVTEGWMNGYTDSTDKDPFRFSLETLERRFGNDKAKELINAWYDNFLTTQDFDNLKELGFNTLRLPFGYRNLQHADGSWIKDAAGHIDFSRIDWAVAQAAQRGMSTILVFHIWDSQQASYSQISENTDAGHKSLAKAEAIWKEVAGHFKGNASIAAFDVINEPTGSWGNLLQDGLYKAVRAVDNDRIIVMESMSADPASLGWKNVVYSIHQYNMMGNDFEANKKAFNDDLNGSIASFKGFNVPTYIGEFMAQENGETLPWLLSQYNSQGLHFTSWTYKTVNMGSWGLCNLPGSVHADLSNGSYDAIKNAWLNMGACSLEAPMVAAFKQATR